MDDPRRASVDPLSNNQLRGFATEPQGERGAEEHDNGADYHLKEEERDRVQDMEAVDKLTSVSQVKPTASQFSKLSGKTYIS